MQIQMSFYEGAFPCPFRVSYFTKERFSIYSLASLNGHLPFYKLFNIKSPATNLL